MITLHYHPSNASFAPHVLLHEIGLPFELKFVDRERNEHKSPAYLALNPNGLIPVLVDGDLVLHETAAICLHLADTHPAAALAPAVGSSERAEFYKWLVWLSSTMQAMLLHYFYPERMVGAGDAEAARQVRQKACERVGGHLEILDAELARGGGRWLLGERYSAADPYAAMLCRWTRGFPTRPARGHDHIGPWLDRVFARPAVRRAVATEGLTPPLYWPVAAAAVTPSRRLRGAARRAAVPSGATTASTGAPSTAG